MRAVRLLEWKSDPVLVGADDPVPGPGQVVVRIGGSGACHSDLHLMHEFEAGLLPWSPPFTLGHENAGWVHALGDGVHDVELGQPVAVHGPWGVELLDLAARGLVRPTITTFPLDEAVHADHLMEAGSALGRQVIVPNAAG